MEFIKSKNIKELSNPGVVSRQLINPKNSKSDILISFTELIMDI